MSTLPARSYRATDLFISGLDDIQVVDRVDVIDDRPVADD